MTPMMRRAMVAIEAHEARTGRTPTVRELSVALGYVRSSWICGQLVNGLELRGFIRRPRDPGAGIVVLRRVSHFANYRFDDELKELVPMRQK